LTRSIPMSSNDSLVFFKCLKREREREREDNPGVSGLGEHVFEGRKIIQFKKQTKPKSNK